MTTSSFVEVSRVGLSKDRRWLTDLWQKDVLWTVGVKEVLLDVRSRYQHIQIVDTPRFGRMLILDANIQCAEKDEAGYHELLVHVGLCRKGAPSPEGGRRVLVLGGGDGGAAREALRHEDVSRVDLVDIDEAVIDAAKRFLPGVWRHPEGGKLDRDHRLRVFCEDGAAFLEQGKGEDGYDLVVVDASDPVGPGTALYSRRFYEAIRGRLRAGGAVCVQAGSFRYLPEVLVTVTRGLGEVFPVVHAYQCHAAVYPGGVWNLAVATLGDDPREVDEARARALKGLCWYSAEVHRGAFALPPLARAVIEREKPDPRALEAALRELVR